LERNELVTAVMLALVSLLLGFGLYAIFFHPLSGELRTRYKGGRQRVARWFKANGKRLLLVGVLVVVAIVLVYVGLRFGEQILERVRELIRGFRGEAAALLPLMPLRSRGSRVPRTGRAGSPPSLGRVAARRIAFRARGGGRGCFGR
jgi:hypothetical protein